MNQTVVAYKPYFFREINTIENKSEHEDRIFNVDEFHTFSRYRDTVYALVYSAGQTERVTIARCNNEDGARYVMDCIIARQKVTEELVIAAEQGYDGMP